MSRLTAMNNILYTEPLTASAFNAYGDVIEVQPQPTAVINQGRCHRYSDLARLEFTDDGGAGISLFQSEACRMPYTLECVERHPLGSQAFVPMSEHSILIVVASDHNDQPVQPRAFVSAAGQGVNYHRGVWHGVLTPLYQPALFAVIDRIGPGNNTEEYWFEQPLTVKHP